LPLAASGKSSSRLAEGLAMDEVRKHTFDSGRVSQDHSQRVFVPRGLLEARCGGSGASTTASQKTLSAVSTANSAYIGKTTQLPSREANVDVLKDNSGRNSSASSRSSPVTSTDTALKLGMNQLGAALQNQVQKLVHEREILGQERLQEYSDQAEQRIIGLEDLVATLQGQVQFLLSERDAAWCDSLEGRQDAAAHSGLEDCSEICDPRIHTLETHVTELGKQVESMVGQHDSHLMQQDRLLAKAETRLLAVEKSLGCTQDLGKSMEKQLASNQALEKSESELMRLFSMLQAEVAMHAQQLSDQKLDQEMIVAKGATWDEDMKHLLEDLRQLRGHSGPGLLQNDAFEQLERDVLGLRGSTEACEELIMGMDERMNILAEEMNMYKRQQEAAVQQFNVRTCHMSKNLLALTIDVKQIGSTVKGSRYRSPLATIGSSSELSSTGQEGKTTIMDHWHATLPEAHTKDLDLHETPPTVIENKIKPHPP